MSKGISLRKRILLKVGIRSNTRYRRVMRVTFLVFGLIAAFFVSILVEEAEYVFASLVLILVILLALLEFVYADSIADKSFPFETERKLELMEQEFGAGAINLISQKLKTAINEFKGCDTSLVSSTVHILTEVNSYSGERSRLGLLQLTDYVGSQGGKKGRVTQLTQGVIGRCARTGDLEVVDFADRNEYSAAMVREFGFTKEETEKHTNSARSYLAYPIKKSEKFIGIIYFFSVEPQVFPKTVDLKTLERLSNDFEEILNLVNLT
jgi:hypothetical protein